MSAEGLKTSKRAYMVGVEDVEQENQGKRVATAWLTLEERPDPTPNRRVVGIKTADGAVYRFQRYATDEYLTHYDRTNADGHRVQQQAPLPAHVKKVRRAILDGEVRPDRRALREAKAEVGMAETDTDAGDTDEEAREAVERAESTSRLSPLRADGGESGSGSRGTRDDMSDTPPGTDDDNSGGGSSE